MRVIDLPEHPDGHAAPITHVTFRGDGARLATCSYDGTVIVWDTAQRTVLARLRHRRLVNAAAWHPADPQLLATASADKTVGVWRVTDGEAPRLMNVLSRHTDDVNSVAWLPDGQRLGCVSEDGRVTLWNALSSAYLGEIGRHTAHCMAVATSRHGLIATVGEDGVVAVADLGRPGGPVTRAYTASVEGCAWSHSGAILAVARDDGVVDLLTPRLERLSTMQVSACAARSVTFTDDDADLVVGAYDGAVHIIGVTGERRRTITDARMWPRCVATAHGITAVGGFGGTPHLFDLSTGAALPGPTVITHGPNALAATDSELLIGCDSGTVIAVDLDHPERVRTVPLGGSPVLSLAALHGVAYAGTYAGEVIAFDHEVRHRARLGPPVTALCAGDLGVVAGTYRGDLIRLDPASGTVLGTGQPHGGSVKSLAAVPGGFLSASTDRTVAAGTLHDRQVLWQHGNLVNAVATLDGAVIATASRDHTVRVGRCDGRTPQTLMGPDESVKAVALLGDPRHPTVVAGSYDFGLHTWTVDGDGAGTLRSGRLLTEFRQAVSCMATVDARRVAVAGWDGRILLVDLDDDGVPRITHDLTVAGLLARSREAVPA